MKIKVDSSALKGAVRDLQKVVDKRSAINIMRSVLLEADNGQLRLLATDGEISLQREIKAEVEEGGKAAVEMENGLAAVLSLPDGDVMIETKGQTINITYHNGSFQLPTGNAENFQPYEAVVPSDRGTVLNNLFITAVRQAIPALSTQNLKPILQCIYIEVAGNGVSVVGANGVIMVYNFIRGGYGNQQKVLLFGKAASVLLSLCRNKTEVSMFSDGNKVALMGESFILTAAQAQGNYPNFRTILKDVKNGIKITADVDRRDLSDTLGRLLPFSDASNLAVLAFDVNTLSVSAEDKDFSRRSSERLSCSTFGDADKIAIGVNIKNIKSVIDILDTEHVSVLMQDRSKPMLIEPIVPEYEGGMASEILLMPMYLNKA